jgi:hypothetical protein
MTVWSMKPSKILENLQTPVYINLFYIYQKKLDILLKSPLVDTKWSIV